MRSLKAIFRGCPWAQCERRRAKKGRSITAASAIVDVLESRVVLSSTSMAIEMNLDKVAAVPAKSHDSIVITDQLITETWNTSTSSLTRTGSLTNAMAVEYSSGGTAANRFDYERPQDLVTIAARASSRMITNCPIDERVFDPSESLPIRLNSDTAYTISLQRSATVKMIDNDFSPAVSIEPAALAIANHDLYHREYSEPRLALKTAEIPMSVGAGSISLAIPHSGTGCSAADGAVRVEMTVSTAEGADYSAICFVGGWGTSMFQFESRFSSGNVTSTMNLETAFTSVSENTAAPILLPVIRTGSGEQALVVRMDISESATRHVDFLWAPQRVPVQPRQTTVIVEMAPINDTIDEDVEDLFFELLGTPSHSIGNKSRLLVSVLEND